MHWPLLYGPELPAENHEKYHLFAPSKIYEFRKYRGVNIERSNFRKLGYDYNNIW